MTAPAAEPPGPLRDRIPATFLERGAALPATTPQLAGARVRLGQRQAIEVLVPNPSGGRGIYVLPCTELDTLCHPTLHDRALIARVSELRTVSPASIRAAALDVAAEGLAGRTAAAAAREARAAEQIRLTEAGRNLPQEIAAEVVPLGRVAALLAAIEALQVQVVADWETCSENRTDFGILAMAARLILAGSRALLAEAWALQADVPALMRRWQADATGLANLLGRSAWLIDGWDRIVVLWNTQDASHSVRLTQILPLLPAIPLEAAAWTGIPLGSHDSLLARRRRPMASRGQAMFDAIAQNEDLLARAAILDAWR